MWEEWKGMEWGFREVKTRKKEIGSKGKENKDKKEK